MSNSTICMPDGSRKEGQRKGDKLANQVKLFIALAGLVFAAGGAWAGIQANAKRVANVETQSKQDHDAIIEIRGDVRYIKENIKDYKVEQREQRALLTSILTEVKAQ